MNKTNRGTNNFNNNIQTNKEPPGAIRLIIILFLGIWLAIPNEISIAHIIIDFVSNQLCPNPTIAFCSQIAFWKVFLNVLGVVIIIVDILYIYKQFKEGHIF